MQVEVLFDTIEHIIPREVTYLIPNDEIKMPGGLAALFVQVLEQKKR